MKLVAKSKDINSYKSMSKEKELSVLTESESAKSKNNLDNCIIKKIKKDFDKLRDWF